MGELVLTRHHESGEIGWYPVTGVIETPQSALLVLTLRHEGGHLQIVETTDEHPYRVGESWTRADELSVGSVVRTFDGKAVVESIQLGGRREPVYNITVGGAHSYLVGYEMVWVHNCFKLPRIDLDGVRGYKPRTVKQRLALEEVASGTAPGRQIMTDLNDLELQNIMPGKWDKYTKVYNLDGEAVEIHWSQHIGGIRWDTKIKTINGG